MKNKQSVLADLTPSKSIVKLAIPATLPLLAKAVYNIVDTAYIGMLNSDIALTAVGVTVPLLFIMIFIENVFAAGAAVPAGNTTYRAIQPKPSYYRLRKKPNSTNCGYPNYPSMHPLNKSYEKDCVGTNKKQGLYGKKTGTLRVWLAWPFSHA